MYPYPRYIEALWFKSMIVWGLRQGGGAKGVEMPVSPSVSSGFSECGDALGFSLPPQKKADQGDGEEAIEE